MKILDFNVHGKNLTLFGFGDLHRGSALSDTNHIIKDLEEAKKRNARIIGTGDIFDVIFYKDPRYAPNILNKKYAGTTNTMDLIIKDTADLLSPYAHLIDVLGDGNHEWQLAKRYSTNPTMRLIERINTKTGSHIKYGGYMYYVVYQFYPDRNPKQSKKGDLVIYVHHGLGGNSPVTKGMIDISRYREAGWQYDILFYAHKHYCIATRALFIKPIIGPKKNTLDVRNVRAVQTGTYKKNLTIENIDSEEIAQWEEKQGFGPSNIGGVFVKAKLRHKNSDTLRNWGFDIRAEI